MNAVPFDTLKMADKLESSGFSAQQAAGVTEALADALFESNLATKGDVERSGAALRGDLAVLRGEMLGIRSELKGDIAQTRTELKAEIAAIRTELTHLIHRMPGILWRA